MRLVVGLGNPGRSYAKTRHNVGFRVADALAERYGVTGWRRRFDAFLAEAVRGDDNVLLVKPQTYMNNSGLSVRRVVDFYRFDIADCLVVCDCWHLPLGRLRVRSRGSDGGHKGLRSVGDHLGSDAFPRLRIGIDPPPDDPVEYVLSTFAGSERKVIDEAIEQACHAVDVWLDRGIDACMNEANG